MKHIIAYTTIIVTLTLFALYERGIRIADMSDVPASQRPSHVFVIGSRI